MEELQLKKLTETESETEAMMLRATLEDSGIKVIMTGMETSALGSAIGGDDVIELFVSHEMEEKAKQLLEEIQGDSDIEIPAWECACGEQVDAGFFVCWSCEAEYSPDSTN